MKRSGFKNKGGPLQRKTIMRSGRNRLVRLVVDLRKLDPEARKGADLAEFTPAGQRRRTWRKVTAYARRERFVEFMGWVKTLPCLLSGQWSGGLTPKTRRTPCSGVIEADHAGDRIFNGSFRKAPDSTCVPLCQQHHVERTNASTSSNGAFPFADAAMREWCDGAIRRIQLHALRVGVTVPDDKGRCVAYAAALASATGAGKESIPW